MVSLLGILYHDVAIFAYMNIDICIYAYVTCVLDFENLCRLKFGVMMFCMVMWPVVPICEHAHMCCNLKISYHMKLHLFRIPMFWMMMLHNPQI